jgi:alpha-L-fucosidase 2
MIRDLFAMSMRSAEILQSDHDFNKKLKTLSKKLVPNLIGKYGQLQEWQADIDSPEDHHRHIAHLYAVCPGSEIHPLITPKLADAAKVSLNLRGDGRYLTNDSASGGNWSMCWRIWCWARLMDGNRANKIFDQMLREQGFENLLTFQHAGYSMGRPDLYRETENLFLYFQLDASASTPGFMAEMLLQSHLDQIILLPALPDEWKDGTVTGLLARGGHKVDIQWKDGELVKAVITTAGKIPVIRVNDKIVTRSDYRIEIRKK